MERAQRLTTITLSFSSARGNWKLSNSEPNLPLPPLAQDFSSVFEAGPPSPTDETGDLTRRMRRRRNSLTVHVPADSLGHAQAIGDEEPLWLFEDSIDDSCDTYPDLEDADVSDVVIRDVSSDEEQDERGRTLRMRVPVDGRPSSSLPTSPERPKKPTILQAPLHIACVAHTTSTCPNGSSCPFSHPLSPRPPPPRLIDFDRPVPLNNPGLTSPEKKGNVGGITSPRRNSHDDGLPSNASPHRSQALSHLFTLRNADILNNMTASKGEGAALPDWIEVDSLGLPPHPLVPRMDLSAYSKGNRRHARAGSNSSNASSVRGANLVVPGRSSARRSRRGSRSSITLPMPAGLAKSDFIVSPIPPFRSMKPAVSTTPTLSPKLAPKEPLEQQLINVGKPTGDSISIITESVVKAPEAPEGSPTAPPTAPIIQEEVIGATAVTETNIPQPQVNTALPVVSPRAMISEASPAILAAYSSRGAARKPTHLDDLLEAMNRARATSGAMFAATLNPAQSAQYAAMQKASKRPTLEARPYSEQPSLSPSLPMDPEHAKSTEIPTQPTGPTHTLSTKPSALADLDSVLDPVGRRVTVPSSVVASMRSPVEKGRFSSGLFGSLSNALPFSFPSREKKLIVASEQPLLSPVSPETQKEGFSQPTSQHVVELHSPPPLRQPSQLIFADPQDTRRESASNHSSHSARSSRSSNTYVSSTHTSKESVSPTPSGPSFTDPMRPLFTGYDNMPVGVKNSVEWTERQRAKDLRQAQRLHKALKDKRDGFVIKLAESGRDADGILFPQQAFINGGMEPTQTEPRLMSVDEVGKIVQDIKSVDESIERVEKEIVAHGGEVGGPIVYSSPTHSQSKPSPVYNTASILPTPPIEHDKGQSLLREKARDARDVTNEEREREKTRQVDDLIKEQQGLASQEKFIMNTPVTPEHVVKAEAERTRRQPNSGVAGMGINWGLLAAANRATVIASGKEAEDRTATPQARTTLVKRRAADVSIVNESNGTKVLYSSWGDSPLPGDSRDGGDIGSPPPVFSKPASSFSIHSHNMSSQTQMSASAQSEEIVLKPRRTSMSTAIPGEENSSQTMQSFDFDEDEDEDADDSREEFVSASEGYDEPEQEQADPTEVVEPAKEDTVMRPIVQRKRSYTATGIPSMTPALTQPKSALENWSFTFSSSYNPPRETESPGPFSSRASTGASTLGGRATPIASHGRKSSRDSTYSSIATSSPVVTYGVVPPHIPSSPPPRRAVIGSPALDHSAAYEKPATVGVKSGDDNPEFNTLEAEQSTASKDPYFIVTRSANVIDEASNIIQYATARVMSGGVKIGSILPRGEDGVIPEEDEDADYAPAPDESQNIPPPPPIQSAGYPNSYPVGVPIPVPAPTGATPPHSMPLAPPMVAAMPIMHGQSGPLPAVMPSAAPAQVMPIPQPYVAAVHPSSRSSGSFGPSNTAHPHPPPPVIASSAPQQQSTQIEYCGDYRTTGHCRFGARCRYSHDIAPRVRTNGSVSAGSYRPTAIHHSTSFTSGSPKIDQPQQLVPAGYQLSNVFPQPHHVKNLPAHQQPPTPFVFAPASSVAHPLTSPAATAAAQRGELMSNTEKAAQILKDMGITPQQLLAHQPAPVVTADGEILYDLTKGRKKSMKSPYRDLSAPEHLTPSSDPKIDKEIQDAIDSILKAEEQRQRERPAVVNSANGIHTNADGEDIWTVSADRRDRSLATGSVPEGGRKSQEKEHKQPPRFSAEPAQPQYARPTPSYPPPPNHQYPPQHYHPQQQQHTYTAPPPVPQPLPPVPTQAVQGPTATTATSTQSLVTALASLTPEDTQRLMATMKGLGFDLSSRQGQPTPHNAPPGYTVVSTHSPAAHPGSTNRATYPPGPYDYPQPPMPL